MLNLALLFKAVFSSRSPLNRKTIASRPPPPPRVQQTLGRTHFRVLFALVRRACHRLLFWSAYAMAQSRFNAHIFVSDCWVLFACRRLILFSSCPADRERGFGRRREGGAGRGHHGRD